MRVLALDTASPSPALALVTDPASVEIEPLPKAAAEALVARLDALLSRLGLDVKALDRVAVLSGPGSFTGLRAGSAFARGLARARGIPLIAIGTFAAASEAVPGPDVDFILDAGRGEVHRARRRADALEEFSSPVPRERAIAEAQRARVSLLDLAVLEGSLAGALGRLASSATPDPTPRGPSYGRLSAAEEKLLPR